MWHEAKRKGENTNKYAIKYAILTHIRLIRASEGNKKLCTRYTR